MQNSITTKSAMLGYLKSQASITSLLGSPTDIKERQWQGEDFEFPAIRVSLDYMPSLNGCGPDDAEFMIEVFSDKPSSMEADNISGTISTLLHKHPFTYSGVKFPVVIVTKVDKAERSIYGWLSRINLKIQVV